VIPPAVQDTYLKGHVIQKSEFSISGSEMTDSFIEGLKNDLYEITAGTSKRWVSLSKAQENSDIFRSINH
jgi:short-subunit dehydrogenase involved in D-alanine esterification of teichoic acids